MNDYLNVIIFIVQKYFGMAEGRHICFESQVQFLGRKSGSLQVVIFIGRT